MTQKHVLIIFILIAVAGFLIMGINSLKETISSSSIASTPTPTQKPEEVIFNQVSPTKAQAQAQTSPQFKKKIYQSFPGILSSSELINKKAVIETNKGNIELEIYPEASRSASNFIFLAKDGFYNGLIFHRVEPNFVIQGGDPLGSGMGGPGYKFADDPVTRKYNRGIVAMANSGPNTNGSQFFIMLADTPSLPPKYSIFGKVISGMEVVDQIKIGDMMNKITIFP